MKVLQDAKIYEENFDTKVCGNSEYIMQNKLYNIYVPSACFPSNYVFKTQY